MQTRKTKKSESEVSDFRKSIEGKYANYFKVGYNAFEFVIDFGQNYSENDQAELNTRVILTPAFVRLLNEYLGDCIQKYEKKFGRIQNSNLSEKKGIKKNSEKQA